MSATSSTPAPGWKELLEGFPWFAGAGHYPLPAYSEFMPPPRLGRSPWPYSQLDRELFCKDDPYGWHISEFEEEYELKPGLAFLADHILSELLKLGQGHPAPKIAGRKGRNLQGNPYWPPELASRAGHLDHERYVLLLPLALSRTQDDKGRVRWTFFGGSEQGPEKAFWKGFYLAPGQERPAPEALAFLSRLLAAAYGEPDEPAKLGGLGFRILPSQKNERFPYWPDTLLPSWTQPFLIDDQTSLDNVRYLLTFRPFSHLPGPARERYLAGKLNLLPFPGSLVFWGMPSYAQLSDQLPTAFQAPLQRVVPRQNDIFNIRVDQSGWLHAPHPNHPTPDTEPELLVNEYRRTHRWQRVERHENDVDQSTHVDKITRVLFSTDLDAIGLYDKPLARNAQIWTEDAKLLLDGPNATRQDIRRATEVVSEGGDFRYRMQWPPMRVGRHEVTWHRPLVAFVSAPQGKPETVLDAPLGYLTAYPVGSTDLTKPVELWPRLLRRQLLLLGLRPLDDEKHDLFRHQTPLNIVSLVNNWERWGRKPLPRGLARALLRIAHNETLAGWLDRLPERAADPQTGHKVREELEKLLEQRDKPETLPDPITYDQTATRAFEERFWNDIVTLAHGQFITKDNADTVQDEATQKAVPHPTRDLEALGDALLARYRQLIADAGMTDQAAVGDLPFRWQTDFDYTAFGGWHLSQGGAACERNLLVIIPGKNHNEAVVLSDHYDTAYMEDVYDKDKGGSGARLSARGADDDHSGTSAILEAAPVFLKLAKEDRLERDVWLLHLTGEEFPSDCLGARDLARGLVEQSLQLHMGDGSFMDLSSVRIAGIFDMDMIAHNRDDRPDIIQIAPGKSPEALQCAYQAFLAAAIWNQTARKLNQGHERRGLTRSQRSKDPDQIPAIAQHLEVHAEVRSIEDPASSLYNTDGQIFSDIGAPCVLFMENYDINRAGYHDTHDTMENIDLDYGAAFAAICIETVARMATLPAV